MKHRDTPHESVKITGKCYGIQSKCNYFHVFLHSRENGHEQKAYFYQRGPRNNNKIIVLAILATQCLRINEVNASLNGTCYKCYKINNYIRGSFSIKITEVYKILHKYLKRKA